jgi:choline dehydrogenase-like flavoprotein
MFNSGDSIVNHNGKATNPQFQARATAVENALVPEAPRQTVFASKEVLIAAGAIHSSQLLQLSGIGSSWLLESLNISVV